MKGELLKDLLEKLGENPKTTAAGVAGLVVAIAAKYGFHLDTETIAFIGILATAFVGVFSKDGGKKE